MTQLLNHSLDAKQQSPTPSVDTCFFYDKDHYTTCKLIIDV
jgi:hypothetical protein